MRPIAEIQGLKVRPTPLCESEEGGLTINESL
jgi:hypothetical protein